MKVKQYSFDLQNNMNQFEKKKRGSYNILQQSWEKRQSYATMRLNKTNQLKTAEVGGMFNNHKIKLGTRANHQQRALSNERRALEPKAFSLTSRDAFPAQHVLRNSMHLKHKNDNMQKKQMDASNNNANFLLVQNF